MTNDNYDFANILFAGPCNLRCPYCIGRQIDPVLSENNLNRFPLKNLECFVAMLKKYNVTEVTFTGTTTDPQLYKHEAKLLAWLRTQLPPQTQYALHTNGQLAVRKMDTFNLYDRVCISFPSFKAAIYQKMMGSPKVPNLAEIIRQSQIPIKLSCIINEHNAKQVDGFLAHCHKIGIKRLVFRQLYGDNRQWNILQNLPQKSTYRQNPVYDYNGMEVTHWNFKQSSSTSLNLFSNGLISPHYLLTKASKFPVMA